MKILVITNNPDRASFRQRVGIYLTALAASGIDCKVECFSPNPFVRWKFLQKSCDFDAVFLHKKRLNPFDAFIFRRRARKVIYDFDDAVMYSDKYPNIPSLKRLISFRRTIELADLVIAGNIYLAEHARRFNDNVKILPTGLNVSEYDVKAPRPADGKLRLVWMGSKVTLPHLAAIKTALEEIGSRCDNVVLRITCDSFFDLRNIKVEKRRWAPETQVRDLITSDIGLAPLPDNRFTRGKCGFKFLQYAAAALPVIASPVGVNAEYVQEGVNGFLAGSRSEWVEKISLLIRNPHLRKQMGLKGRCSVERFDSKVLGQELVELLRSCFEKQGKS